MEHTIKGGGALREEIGKSDPTLAAKSGEHRKEDTEGCQVLVREGTIKSDREFEMEDCKSDSCLPGKQIEHKKDGMNEGINTVLGKEESDCNPTRSAKSVEQKKDDTVQDGQLPGEEKKKDDSCLTAKQGERYGTMEEQNSETESYPTLSAEPGEGGMQETSSEGDFFDRLPKVVLVLLTRYLPTLYLIVMANIHPAFQCLLQDRRFRNAYTRFALLADSGSDITYDVIPLNEVSSPNWWFQRYMHEQHPKLVKLVHHGDFFFDLLCFKYKLHNWIFEGLRLGYPKRVYIKYTYGPFPREGILSLTQSMESVLNKLAICYPQLLNKNFRMHRISPGGPVFLRFVWSDVVPHDYRLNPDCQCSCEMIAGRLQSLVSVFLSCDSEYCVCWGGVTVDVSDDYPKAVLKLKETWDQCRFPIKTSLSAFRQSTDKIFTMLLQYFERGSK